MSIQDAITNASSPGSSRKIYISFYDWYDALPEDERNTLDEAVLSDRISNRKLYRSLKETENVPFGDNAFYYYVNNLKAERG